MLGPTPVIHTRANPAFSLGTSPLNIALVALSALFQRIYRWGGMGVKRRGIEGGKKAVT